MAYNTKKYGADAPKTGPISSMCRSSRAALAAIPADTSVAALADGVPPDKLYPLDLDRAFKKLEAFKPNISAWWTTGAQATQFARDQEVDMLSMWNGRASAI